MSAQLKRSLVAALIAAAVLLVAHWFDAGVLVDAQRQAGYTFDPAPLMDLMVVAHVLTAAGAVALALVAWRSRSVLVGVGYVLVGGFLVCLPALVWALAVSVNGAAPLAPAPIATTMDQWFTVLATGVTGAVFTIAGGMLLSGLALIWSVFQDRRSTESALPATGPAAQSDAI
jgi:hypothetical protein